MNNYTTLKRGEAILVCRKCGALVGNESRDSHEAWHKNNA